MGQTTSDNPGGVKSLFEDNNSQKATASTLAGYLVEDGAWMVLPDGDREITIVRHRDYGTIMYLIDGPGEDIRSGVVKTVRELADAIAVGGE